MYKIFIDTRCQFTRKFTAITKNILEKILAQKAKSSLDNFKRTLIKVKK